MKTVASPLLMVAVMLALLGATACNRLDAQLSTEPPGKAPGPPMVGSRGDEAFAILRDGSFSEEQDDEGITYVTRLEFDKATRTLIAIQTRRKKGAPEIFFYRDRIDLRQIDPAKISIDRDTGITIAPYPGRKAVTREFFENDGTSMGPSDAPTYGLPYTYAAQTYRLAGAFRDLVNAAQDIAETPPPPADPVATLTALISGTHWTWYEGDFLRYKPRMRYWIDFYSDGTARVPWRETPQAWKVAADGTLTVSDSKVRDAHLFVMDVVNKSGSLANGKLHIQYEGPVFEPPRRGEAFASDADAAFADVKRLCDRTFTIDKIVETTVLTFDEPKGLLTLKSTTNLAPHTRTFQLEIDLRKIDPARLKIQNRQLRIEPYAGKVALRATNSGSGAFRGPTSASVIPVYDLSPAEATQHEGLAEVFRELVTAVQKSPPP